MDLLANLLGWISRAVLDVMAFRWLYRREIDTNRAQGTGRRAGRQRARALKRSRRAAASRRRTIRGGAR